jgi:hypothetical protein
LSAVPVNGIVSGIAEKADSEQAEIEDSACDVQPDCGRGIRYEVTGEVGDDEGVIAGIAIRARATSGERVPGGHGGAIAGTGGGDQGVAAGESACGRVVPARAHVAGR